MIDLDRDLGVVDERSCSTLHGHARQDEFLTGLDERVRGQVQYFTCAGLERESLNPHLAGATLLRTPSGEKGDRRRRVLGVTCVEDRHDLADLVGR